MGRRCGFDCSGDDFRRNMRDWRHHCHAWSHGHGPWNPWKDFRDRSPCHHHSHGPHRGSFGPHGPHGSRHGPHRPRHGPHDHSYGPHGHGPHGPHHGPRFWPGHWPHCHHNGPFGHGPFGRPFGPTCGRKPCNEETDQRKSARKNKPSCSRNKDENTRDTVFVQRIVVEQPERSYSV